MRTLRILLIVCLSLLATVVLAQDGALLVGDITGDSATYYGQTVTVEGNVDELVNIRSFLLGEGGLTNPQLLVLNNSGQEFNIGLTAGARVTVTGVVYPSYSEGGWDQIMSAVTSGQAGQPQQQPMDQPQQSGEVEQTVTEAVGGVQDMATEAVEGAEDMIGAGEPMATEPMSEAMPTEVPVTGTGAGGGVGLQEYPVVILSERFPEHTLLVVNSVEDIRFVQVE